MLGPGEARQISAIRLSAAVLDNTEPRHQVGQLGGHRGLVTAEEERGQAVLLGQRQQQVHLAGRRYHGATGGEGRGLLDHGAQLTVRRAWWGQPVRPAVRGSEDQHGVCLAEQRFINIIQLHSNAQVGENIYLQRAQDQR